MPTPQYQAKQAADGSWTIFNVPIFAEHQEKLPSGRLFNVDRPWLEAALKRSLARQAEGYLPPLHVRHHARPGEVQAATGAGRFQITRVGMLPYEGRMVWALFANLVGVRPEVYQKIRAGELPYRSVEILKPQVQEIDSLALLDDEVPYFRFPLLRVVEQGSPVAAVYAANSGPRKNAGLALSFKFPEGSTMADEPIMRADDEAPPAADKPEDAKPEAPEAPPAWAQSMLQILQQIAAKMGMGADDGQAVPMGAAVSTPLMAQAEQVDGRVDGRLDALREEVVQLKAARQVDTACDALRDRGIGEKQIKRFRELARTKGLSYAQGFAESMVPEAQDPPQTWTGEVRHEAPDAAEVAHYAQQGPEYLEAARSVAKSWQRHRATGGTRTLKEYLDANVGEAVAAAL